MTLTRDLIEKLWQEVLHDLPMPSEHWEHWLRLNPLTFIRGLQIFAEKRLRGRFDDGAPRTGEDYGMYLSAILRNISSFSVPLTLLMGHTFTQDDRQRFSKFTRIANEEHAPDGSRCLLWTGALSSKGGYGRFSLARRKEYAHVVSFFLRNGNYLPGEKGLPGVEIHHQCRIPRCVNPDHLQLVLQSTHRSWRSEPRTMEMEDLGDSEAPSVSLIPTESRAEA